MILYTLFHSYLWIMLWNTSDWGKESECVKMVEMEKKKRGVGDGK